MCAYTFLKGKFVHIQYAALTCTTVRIYLHMFWSTGVHVLLFLSEGNDEQFDLFLFVEQFCVLWL